MPFAEQEILTPVPIYLEPAPGKAFSKVVLRYKPFGAASYRTLEMKKLGKGFGVLIPCHEVSTTGELRYYVELTDATGGPAGLAGSSERPWRVQIKNVITGPAPALPGKAPPARCKDIACP